MSKKTGINVRSEYSPAERMILQKAAALTHRSARMFQKDSALTMAREVLKGSGDAPGKDKKDD